MKNKMVIKLILGFSIVLLLFSLIIGIVFMSLFKDHTMNVQSEELQKRAETMAATLTEIMSNSTSGSSRQNGYGMYMRFMNDIAMTDVWIVDENLQLITSGPMSARNYQYSDLPEAADIVVKNVFMGYTTYSEGFSNLLNTPVLTVGAPIYNNNEVIGALLLHTPISGIQEGIKQGFTLLLLSMAVALMLTVILSALLAIAFVKPIKKIQNTTLQLAEGNYQVHTGVKRNDEIGQLAGAIDILSGRLDTADKQSEQLQKLRQDFVSNISHELRTPVTVIRGSLEALCDEVVTDPAQIKKYHQQMLRESIYLQRLVDDLLELSRLQNADFKIEMSRINLCDVLNDAVRSASQIANKKNIRIFTDTKDPVCSITGDYGRLRQMFLIILDNAVKFSPENSMVSVSVTSNNVTIQDQGIGIAKEDLPYIFDRFYKAKSEENKNGTGLGLSIAKQIAQRHQIDITTQSTLGEGTKFIFSF